MYAFEYGKTLGVSVKC